MPVMFTSGSKYVSTRFDAAITLSRAGLRFPMSESIEVERLASSRALHCDLQLLSENGSESILRTGLAMHQKDTL